MVYRKKRFQNTVCQPEIVAPIQLKHLGVIINLGVEVACDLQSHTMAMIVPR
jgi:hypothetical protein